MNSALALAVASFAIAPEVGAAPVEKQNPGAVAKPVGAYSHVAVVPPGTRLLYLAGQIGNRPDGTLPATVEEQFVQALENVRLILASQGAGPEHVVKLMFYVSAKPTNWAPIREKRAAMFRGVQPPPATWVYVSELIRAEYLVEVEAVAAVPHQSR